MAMQSKANQELGGGSGNRMGLGWIRGQTCSEGGAGGLWGQARSMEGLGGCLGNQRTHGLCGRLGALSPIPGTRCYF